MISYFSKLILIWTPVTLHHIKGTTTRDLPAGIGRLTSSVLPTGTQGSVACVGPIVTHRAAAVAEPAVPSSSLSRVP